MMFESWWIAHQFELLVTGIMLVVIVTILVIKFLLDLRTK